MRAYSAIQCDSQPMATHAPRARAAAWAGCAADLTPAFARAWCTTRSPSLASLSLPLGSTKMVPSYKLLLPQASAQDGGMARWVADALDDSTDALDIGSQLDQREQASVSCR